MIERLLPKIMAVLTRQPRYKPQIVWSNKSWTHNVFRFYEMIFWRRHGIRAEVSSTFVGSKTISVPHSFEAHCALAETYIRSLFTFQPIKILIPRMVTTTGTQIPVSPFLFAIAHDTDTDSGAGSVSTWSHTCTGSNLVLLVTYANTGLAVTGITYNSVAMSALSAGFSDPLCKYLLAPSTGANNVVVSGSLTGNKRGLATSYSGVAQTSFPDSSNTLNSGGDLNGQSVSTTVVAANCWLFAMGNPMNNSNGDISAVGTTKTSRISFTFYRVATTGIAMIHADSNGTVATGSQSVTFTDTLSGGNFPGGSALVLSMAPAAASATVTPSTLLLMRVG